MATHTPPPIEIDGLHVEFSPSPRRRIVAVDDLDLTVQPGEVVGFIGPNGAGKTTTIKALMGFLKPDRGTLRLFGAPAGDVAVRHRIGYLPEVAVYYPFLTAREALRLYAKAAGLRKDQREQAITELVAQVGLSGRDRERLRNYSKGMLQRVGIAQALLGGPELLILDEVTSGLDPVARHDVRALLMAFKARGNTVFFSSHELTEVALLCDRVILLDEGKVVEESRLEDLLASNTCVAVHAEAEHPATELPAGAFTRLARHGWQVYAADNWDTARALQRHLEAEGARVHEVREEPPSLEDYFVQKLGHKVT